jgi:ABC-type transport system involved in cytochrome c biogenesis permease component
MLTDTAGVAAVLWYVTGLFRQIIESLGYEATRAAILLFLVVGGPLLALIGYALGAVPVVDGWREALLLGVMAVPQAIGLYEIGKTLAEKMPLVGRRRDA